VLPGQKHALAALGPGHRHVVGVDDIHGNGRRVADPHDHDPVQGDTLGGILRRIGLSADEVTRGSTIIELPWRLMPTWTPEPALRMT